jgi:branched-chain amino acid transport system ATP-binding protein
VLEVDGVSGGYGKVEVLHGVRLTVPDGAVVALVGANGAGKTTLLRLIAGLVPPTRGEVRVDRRSTRGLSPYEVARRGVCLIPEGRGIFPALTVGENLAMQAVGGDGSIDRALTYFPVLKQRITQRAGTLSGGEQQMLALSRALVTRPRLLMLDEISMGLAPIIVEQLFETVGELARDGISILLVEQYLTYALRMAEYVCVLGKGRVQFLGEPAELAGRDVSMAGISAP